MTDTREGYRLLKVWIPDGDKHMHVDPDQWHAVRELRFCSDEKAFFHGLSSLLDLNSRQEQMLLTMYATKYHEALARAGDSPRRYNKANQSANAWLRNGCRGFLVRE